MPTCGCGALTRRGRSPQGLLEILGQMHTGRDLQTSHITNISLPLSLGTFAYMYTYRIHSPARHASGLSLYRWVHTRDDELDCRRGGDSPDCSLSSDKGFAFFKHARKPQPLFTTRYLVFIRVFSPLSRYSSLSFCKLFFLFFSRAVSLSPSVAFPDFGIQRLILCPQPPPLPRLTPKKFSFPEDTRLSRHLFFLSCSSVCTPLSPLLHFTCTGVRGLHAAYAKSTRPQKAFRSLAEENKKKRRR